MSQKKKEKILSINKIKEREYSNITSAYFLEFLTPLLFYVNVFYIPLSYFILINKINFFAYQNKDNDNKE